MSQKAARVECEVCGALTRNPDGLCRECGPADRQQVASEKEQFVENYSRMVEEGWPYSDSDEDDI